MIKVKTGMIFDTNLCWKPSRGMNVRVNDLDLDTSPHTFSCLNILKPWGRPTSFQSWLRRKYKCLIWIVSSETRREARWSQVSRVQALIGGRSESTYGTYYRPHRDAACGLLHLFPIPCTASIFSLWRICLGNWRLFGSPRNRFFGFNIGCRKHVCSRRLAADSILPHFHWRKLGLNYRPWPYS